MPALALTTDLVLHSQLAGAAERAGVQVQFVAHADELLARLERARPSLVVLDLNHPGALPVELLPAIRAQSPASIVLAFGPHVHKQRLAAATSAGCDLVMSRGQFHAEMENLLRQYGGEFEG